MSCSPSRNAKQIIPRLRVELTSSTRATCGAVSVNAAEFPILKMCRLLVDAGFDPSIGLECFRGSTLCLTVSSIGDGARLTAARDGVGFRIRPNSDAVTAPPIRKNRRLEPGHRTTSGTPREALTAGEV